MNSNEENAFIPEILMEELNRIFPECKLENISIHITPIQLGKQLGIAEVMSYLRRNYEEQQNSVRRNPRRKDILA